MDVDRADDPAHGRSDFDGGLVRLELDNGLVFFDFIPAGHQDLQDVARFDIFAEAG